ncbi:SLOG family protein [Providencia sp. PROV089]|uniref:SLOG family protein n=1 Tax=Providencia sp. PROV089 TaxID=2949805 RepID=UPI00234AD84A|nr:SLOG family protein [Providencia sp. PROV089]
MIVAATGHRLNKLGYDEGSQFLCDIIAEVYLRSLKPELVYTGMAIGWDTNIARACVSLKIPFIAAVPFQGQECKWNSEQQAEYKRLILLAKEIVVVCKGEYSLFKMQARNEYMVDRSDTVLAMFNRSLGGTFNCVRYAKSKKKNIINAWKAYSELI